MKNILLTSIFFCLASTAFSASAPDDSKCNEICRIEREKKQRAAESEAQARFSQAHRMTRGINFTESICAQAIPHLVSARIQGASSYDYASFQYGKCLLVQKKYAEAAAAFKSVLDLPITNRGTITDLTRIELAALYQRGLGVPKDPGQALGLYHACDLEQLPPGTVDHWQVDPRRAAAELIISVNPWPTKRAYQLLTQHGVPISSFWRALNLMIRRNEIVQENFYASALAEALQDNTEPGNEIYLPDTPETVEIVEKFRVKAAKQVLDKAGNMKAAISYLRHAHSPEAQLLSKDLQRRLGYVLAEAEGLPDFRTVAKIKHSKLDQEIIEQKIKSEALASQLEGKDATGLLIPIRTGSNKIELNAKQDNKVPYLSNWALVTNLDVYRPDTSGHLFLLHISTPNKNSIDDEKPLTIYILEKFSLDSLWKSQEFAPSDANSHLETPACVSPVKEGDPGASEGDVIVPKSSGWRWQQINKKWVLIAGFEKMEGYAGGGGSFSYERWLYYSKSGELRPVSCYQTAYSLLLAGDWRPNGVREHHEYNGQWRVQLQTDPRQQWPQIQLIPKVQFPAQPRLSKLRLRWSPEQNAYQAHRGKSQ
ncbi:tetratricopeptide (TPR) repeat protein [Pseudacidovorax sp. 1753]|uniref:hypothetical protein n=1 Tax=Pseudacidovorax sp. 1753 TaxID=3156419 RepID=UPI003397E7A8